jgi:hypothetical protein
MENVFLYRLIRPAIILGICGVVFGCVSTPTKHEVFIGEGFQASLPNPGTRVVVWGNHSGAVTRTLRWLQDHQLLGVDPSLIEKELTDPKFAHRNRMEQKRQVLVAAQSLGAPLVVFAYRGDSQFGQEFDLMSFGHKRTKIIAIEIRGIKSKTGDVVFGAKAWNSEPLVESEQMVQDLTTFTLQKAWNQSDHALPVQQEVAQHKPQREQVTVVTSYSDEVPPEPELSKSASDGPLSLQQEVAQPKPQQEEVSVASSYSAEMPPTLKPSKSEMVESQSYEEEPSLGLQIAGGALSVLYTPFKVVYAGLGGVMGGLAYLVTAGNEQVAQSIWDASLHGTYWLTAKHLQGKETIHFKGEPSQIDPVHQAHLNELMTVGAVGE